MVLGWLPACLVEVQRQPGLYWLLCIPATAVGAVALLLVYLRAAELLVDWCGQWPMWLSRSIHALPVFIGRSSYSTYLWHFPFVLLLLLHLHAERLVGWGRFAHFKFFLLFCSGSLLLGAAGYLLVEVPALGLRKRWFPERRQAITAVETAPLRKAA